MSQIKIPPRFSLIRIDWVDATIIGRDSGWQPAYMWDDALANKPDGLLCSTVGWLLRRDPLRIVVAQSYNQFAHMADCMSIPTGCIREIRVLTPPPEVLKRGA